MSYWVWCPEYGETREDAREDRISQSSERAAEREAERVAIEDYRYSDRKIVVMVAKGDEDPRLFAVHIETRLEFIAREANK